MLLVQVKDGIAILSQVGIVAWIVTFPEDVEEVQVTDLLWVIFNTDNLAVVADAAVRRRSLAPTRIADRSAYNPRNTPEPGVDTPESAQRE